MDEEDSKITRPNDAQKNREDLARKRPSADDGEKMLTGITAAVGLVALEKTLEPIVLGEHIKRVARILEQRIGTKINIKLGDHFPPPGYPLAGGELSARELQSTPPLSGTPDESTWYGPVEILGKDRIEELNSILGAAKNIIALDDGYADQYAYRKEIAEANTKEKVSKLLAYLVVTGVSQQALYGVLNRLPKSYSNQQYSGVSRRDFLKIFATAAIGATIGVNTGRNIAVRPETDNLPQVWRDIYEIIPHEKTVEIRDMTMSIGANSLHSVTMPDEEFAFFAGNGHIRILDCLELEPEDLKQKYQDDVGAVYGQFLELYKKYEGDDRQSVLDTAVIFARTIPPVVYRENHSGVDEKGLMVKQTDTVYDSAGVAFLDLLHDKISNAVSGSDEEKFYQIVAHSYLVYHKQWEKLVDEGYTISFPRENSSADTRQYDMPGTGKTIIINGGHLVRIEQTIS